MEVGNLTDLPVTAFSYFDNEVSTENRVAGGDDIVLLYLNQHLDLTQGITWVLKLYFKLTLNPFGGSISGGKFHTRSFLIFLKFF